MKHAKTLIFFLLLIIWGTLSNAQEKKDWKVKWDNGFKVESADKNFKLKFGGRIMYDMAFFGQDDDIETAFGEMKSGTEFRRARFFNSGTVYDRVKYKLQVDLSGGKATLKDAYLELTKLGPMGNLRVGNFKEPMRLEVLTSSKYITFMERSFPTNFSQERNAGLMFHNQFDDDRLGIQLGAFRNADGNGNDKNAGENWNVTARASYLPIRNAEEKQLLHVGASYSARNPKDDEYKVSARPEAHLSEKYVSTGTIANTDNVNLVNFETAFVHKSLSLQGEYLMSGVKRSVGDDLNFSGYYGQASYWVTGESRNYKSSYDGFGRTKPNNNLGADNGGGGLELTLRYSGIDLKDDNINGGNMNDWTLGANWHLNPVTRIMANYTNAKVENIGNANIFQVRFQIDF